jgi:flavin-dependent dehydrogenase
VLDRVLVDGALAAGVEVRFGAEVGRLIRDREGRVLGVLGRDRAGVAVTARAALTVGADGVRSTVAREVGAPILGNGTGAGAIIYGYWSELPVAGYEWYYRPGHSAGLIPTNDGQVCVFGGVPAADLAGPGRGDLAGAYHRILAAATGGADGRLASGRPPRRLRTWMGRPGFVRQAHGPGWVLVGDAGSFVDPLSTHGITDALRDAATLARALDGGDLAGDLDAALRRFSADRDAVVASLFPVVDRIAGYRWDGVELRRSLLELSSAMSAEAELMAAWYGARVPS